MKESIPIFHQEEITAVINYFDTLAVRRADRKASLKIIDGVHPALGDFGKGYQLAEIPNSGWLKDALSGRLIDQKKAPAGFSFKFFGTNGTSPSTVNEAEAAIKLLKTLEATKRNYIKLEWSGNDRWNQAEELTKNNRGIRIGEQISSPDYYVYEVLFAGYEEYEKPLMPKQSALVLQGFREAMTSPKTEAIGFRIIHSES